MAWSRSKQFDAEIRQFLKEFFFEKVNYEKKNADDNLKKKYPACKESKECAVLMSCTK